MALAVPKEGKCKLFINRLFPVQGDDSFEVVYHDDTDLATEGLAKFLPAGRIGIDRFLYSQFLIQLLEQRSDIVPKVGSYVVEATCT